MFGETLKGTLFLKLEGRGSCWAFQDERCSGPGGTHILMPGDHLKIIRNNEVVFNGVLMVGKAVSDYLWAQEGIVPADWSGFFTAQLPAELTFSAPKSVREPVYLALRGDPLVRIDSYSGYEEGSDFEAVVVKHFPGKRKPLRILLSFRHRCTVCGCRRHEHRCICSCLPEYFLNSFRPL